MNAYVQILKIGLIGLRRLFLVKWIFIAVISDNLIASKFDANGLLLSSMAQ